MILADTSVWIDHLRRGDDTLVRLLHETLVLTHPFVIGEIALGSIRNRTQLLRSLALLPVANQAADVEVLAFIAAEAMAGTGIGYLDAHLLVSARLTPGAKLWTRDRKLRAAAEAAGLAAAFPGLQ